MLLAFKNGRVLTEQGIEEGRAVLANEGRIEAIIDDKEATRAAHVVDLRGDLLVPGFIDTQVNGGGGVLFNDDPSIETIAHIGRAHRKFGTTGFLPTLISDDLDVVVKAVSAVRDAIRSGVPGVLGIHIEGPYLNADRRGVHDATKLRWLEEDALEMLTASHGGKTVVTLAPERTRPEIIRKLVAAGVIVSAGHTNATFQELQVALAHGVTGFTHLFNAMSQLTGREPGAVGAALAHPESWCGIIVDGHHVHPAVLQIALRSKRRDRFMLVTDAMPSVGAANKSFQLQGRPISVADNMCVDEQGRLAGSDIDMACAVRNARQMLRLDLTDALKMASAYPTDFLGIATTEGRIAPGQRANFALLDEELKVKTTWIDGRQNGDH